MGILIGPDTDNAPRGRAECFFERASLTLCCYPRQFLRTPVSGGGKVRLLPVVWHHFCIYFANFSEVRYTTSGRFYEGSIFLIAPPSIFTLSS
jgi:hypothetical protein